MGVFDFDVIVGRVGVFVQNADLAGLREIVIDGFNGVTRFHGFIGNIFQNGCHGVAFLGVDDHFRAVAGAAHFGDAACRNIGKGCSGE